jgi:hypothetical protein
MEGTEKQIKWAKDIRDNFQGNFPDMSSNPITQKAKDFVLGIDNAAFWLDHRKRSPQRILRDLIGGGLAIRGFQFPHRAKLDKKTGTITITW